MNVKLIRNDLIFRTGCILYFFNSVLYNQHDEHLRKFNLNKYIFFYTKIHH